MSDKSNLLMFQKNLEGELVEKFGLLVSGKDLAGLLGYESLSSFNQAYARKKLPIAVFTLKNKRGKYAFCKEVAQYLTERRFESNQRNTKEA